MPNSSGRQDGVRCDKHSGIAARVRGGRRTALIEDSIVPRALSCSTQATLTLTERRCCSKAKYIEAIVAGDDDELSAFYRGIPCAIEASLPGIWAYMGIHEQSIW